MITARRTRLLRVSDLAAFQRTLIDFAGGLTSTDTRDTFVLVPTRAAAEQLLRTLEDRLLTSDGRPITWPMIGTRAEWYEELCDRLPTRPVVLNAFSREVTLAAIARDLVEQGIAPPFEIRPALVAEMLALYDLVRRLGRTVADFERNLREELEEDRKFDRGAEKLFQQTVFLSALYAGYESRLGAASTLADATADKKAAPLWARSGAAFATPAESSTVDEHGLRALFCEQASSRPLKRMVITVADRLADADGLWPADYELVTKLPGLETVDIICTEAMLAAGLLERLHGVLPDLEEARGAELKSRPPILVTPKASVAFCYRDREEELAAVARRLKAERRDGRSSPLHRTALIVQRPLPYLYLSRDVFGSAGIPFETLDTLPLAAEPYAAAVDLALDAVSADYTRASVLALLHSPHFRFGQNGNVTLRVIAALDFALADAHYLGGLERLQRFAEEWRGIDVPGSREQRRQKTAAPAALAIAAAVGALAPLGTMRPMVDQIETLVAWLHRFDAGSSAARHARVRAAVIDALKSLADAYRRHDPEADGDVVVLSAAIRRWLGGKTFALSTGNAGLQIVDAQAAKFGDFDDVQLVGLIDGEWPERFRRNVLYPSSILAQLEPLPALAGPGHPERDALNAARAAFQDLLHLARRHVRLSTFVLENDAVIEPSVLLDEVESAGLSREAVEQPTVRVFQAEALALEPRHANPLAGRTAEWARVRLEPLPVDLDRFRGQAGPWTLPRVSVSRLERYLDCPFRFFASEVLRLEEQPEDEDSRTPLERGRFLHELFERFFSEWQRRGYRRIDSGSLAEARKLFESICEDALADLSPAEAALERTRLLGSAVSPGIAHRVFSMEADRVTEIVERLLEYPLQGDFVFRGVGGNERTVTLNAKADRIDLLADGTLRVIDYKSKKTPELKMALQLPIYSFCARTSLESHANRRWSIAEALYVSFEGDKAVVPLKAKGRTLDELIADAQDRLLTTLDRIAEGRFPAQPLRKSLCGPCPYATVCRLEYVEREEAGGSDA